MSNVYLTRIRLEQYRSFRNLDIRLPDGPGVLVVHGSNGIGKSSLFDALEWALTDSIDHFRDADGAKKVGRYLCRWRDGTPGPTSVSLDFSGDKVISRTLSSAEATKSIVGGNIADITSFLRDDGWERNISGLSSYLLLTHFLGQSTISRLTNRDPGERFDILKEAAQSKEVEEVANALHGKGNTTASRAYAKRAKSLEQEVSQLRSLLETEANLWAGLTSVGAMDEGAASEVAQRVSRLLDDVGQKEEKSSAPAFDQSTISNLEERISEQRNLIRTLEAVVEQSAGIVAEWETLSRHLVELQSALKTADDQLSLLGNQRAEAAPSLESAKVDESRKAVAARASLEARQRLLRLQEALRILGTTSIRKRNAESAVTAARAAAEMEAATLERLDRQLQIVRRIEGEVGRLDERMGLAQTELRNVQKWLSRDTRVAQLRSSIEDLKAGSPDLDVTFAQAEAELRQAKEALDRQRQVLNELRSTVSAMSSAVAAIAANLPHEASDCPVCATHFDLAGELHRRAAGAAERLAPLVKSEEERVQLANQRWEQARTEVERLSSIKRELVDLTEECLAKEQENAALAVGLFGIERADRVNAQLRQADLLGRVEELSWRRQRKWHWRGRLNGSFFAPGGEHSSATRRRDQAQALLATAAQEQIVAAREYESANVAVVTIDQAMGHNAIRGDALAESLRLAELELDKAEAASRSSSERRQQIEQELSSLDIASASAVTRRQQIADQIDSASQQKTAVSALWRRLGFAASLEPDLSAVSVQRTNVAKLRGSLREADDLLKQLRDGRAAATLVENHLASLERLRVAVSGAPNSERLQLRKEAEDILAAKSRVAEATQQAKEIARLASADILDELVDFNTSYMQPLDALMKSINRAILCDPRVGIELHVRNRRVEQTATKDGEVPADVGLIDPILVHSEGQMAALSVSMLCAASLTYPWSKWRGLVLDDPLQHNDAIHSAAFADFVCNLVAGKGYQVLLSTHDRAQAEFLRRKIASRTLRCAVLSLLGTGQDGVEWSYRGPEGPSLEVASA